MEQVHLTHHKISHIETDILNGSLSILGTANNKNKPTLMSNGQMEIIPWNSRMLTIIWQTNYMLMSEKTLTSQDGVVELLMLPLM